MLFLGFLSVIQILFLPGLLALKLFNFRNNSLLYKFIVVTGLSLYLNYQIAFWLTLLKIYTKTSFLLIFLLELLVIIFLFRKSFIAFLNISLKDILLKKYNFYRSNSLVNRVMISVSFFIILFYVSLFINNLGSIFYYNDAIKSWNVWALEWASNLFPPLTGHYPQIIPANWSITYIFTQPLQVDFFAKSMMPVIFIGNLLMMLGLAIKKKNGLYLFALMIYGTISPLLYSFVFIADGNTELLVSFFALLSYYVIVYDDENDFDLSKFVLVTIFISAAALTKIAGFYIFCLGSLWIFWYVIVNKNNRNFRNVIISFIVYFLLAAINLSWYFFKPMYQGLDQSSYMLPDFLSRFLHAFDIIYYSIGLPILIFFAVGILFSLFVKKIRILTISIVIPVILLWAFFFSYDSRNLNIAIPFIAIVTPFGIIKLLELITKTSFQNIFLINPSSENNSAPVSNKKLLLIVITGVIAALLIKSNTFFNFLVKINDFIIANYFHYFRINYTIELGYYKYILYFSESLLILLILFITILFLYKYKIKAGYIFVLLFIVFASMSLMFSGSDLENRQIKEKNLVEVRNIYSRSYTYLKYEPGFKQITTNINELKSFFPYPSSRFVFSDQISNNFKYLLISKNSLNENEKELLYSFSTEEYRVFLEDDNYVLVKKVAE